ncbi:MAG TPA: hypothetical protein VNU45_07120 [Rummeliibacillus sp.]|nr:hypothetical protein [Rummeliibacillus sp.]
MRLGVLKEIKNVRRFFDAMERNVKQGNPEHIQKAYMFLAHMVLMMNEGQLTPDSIAIDVELAKEFNNLEIE